MANYDVADILGRAQFVENVTALDENSGRFSYKAVLNSARTISGEGSYERNGDVLILTGNAGETQVRLDDIVTKLGEAGFGLNISGHNAVARVIKGEKRFVPVVCDLYLMNLL